jgi:hypothetical protein
VDLEGNASMAFELFVVPFGHLCVSKERVVSAQETSLVAASDSVGRRVVLPGRVV